MKDIQPESESTTEPETIGAVLSQMVEGRHLTPPDSASERVRKESAEATDLQNQLREAKERQKDLIERSMAGEVIDPNYMRYSGELLIEAVQASEQLRADKS